MKAVDRVDTVRRAYKRRWMAAKRQRMRAETGEPVTLDIPLAMAAKLRARKPYGWSFKQFLLRILSESNRLAEQPGKAAGKPASIVSGADSGARAVQPVLARPAVLGRNERCSCGSGRKFKRCCGSPVPAG